MARILVTGGAGFIGSYVVKSLLDHGHEVVALDNFNTYYDPKLKEDRLSIFLNGCSFPMYRADITDSLMLESIFKKHDFDAVCHLAAQAGVRYSLDNPQAYLTANILGTHQVLECAKSFGVTKIVLASSSSVYGGNEKLPWSEDDDLAPPINVYAMTKQANELQAYTYHHLYGLDVTCLRYFTVYGPWGRPDMAYFKFARAISDGEPIDIYNQGKMKRDFTYIDDIVAGTVSALDRCNGYTVVNLGNHQPVALEEFISMIEQALGKKAQKKYLPMQPGEFLENYADIKKARTLLSWKPQTSPEEGIKKFVGWFREYYKE